MRSQVTRAIILQISFSPQLVRASSVGQENVSREERRCHWHMRAFRDGVALKLNLCGRGLILISSILVNYVEMHVSSLGLKRLG